MERSTKIMRRAIFTFLKNYHHFTCSTSIILLLIPFSVSSLLFQALLRSQSPLHLDLGLGLSLRLSIFLLFSCFSSSVFLLANAKSSILQSFSSPSSLHKARLKIQTFCLLLLCLASASYRRLGELIPSKALAELFSWTVYYTVRTNMTVVFNLAFVLSETRNLSAHAAIREAISLRVRDSATLSLALVSSTGSVAIEALFRYRVVATPIGSWTALLVVLSEGLLIAYMYSLLIVLDTVACFLLVDGKGSDPKPIIEFYTLKNVA